MILYHKNSINWDILNNYHNYLNKTCHRDRIVGLSVPCPSHVSVEHRINFYRSYIQPHMDYANVLWGNAAKTKIVKIERLQKRACKLILK